MTSMPAARAARTASTAVMPQSHVMMSPAPRRRAAARPAGPKSYPSRSRCGTKAWARPPTLESTRVRSAAAHCPSSSYPPWTRIGAPERTAATISSTARDMSTQASGSDSRSRSGRRNALACSGAARPRCTRRAASGSGIWRSDARAAVSCGSGGAVTVQRAGIIPGRTAARRRPRTLRSTRRAESGPARVAMQGVQRERRLAAPDPLVATQQAGAHGRGGALALRERPLALGGDLLALAGERLTQRGLSRPHFFECPLGLRSFTLSFRDRIAGPHELGLLFGEHRAGEVQLRHEGRGFLRAPHPLEPLAPLLLHGAIVGDLTLQLVAPVDRGLDSRLRQGERALGGRVGLVERRQLGGERRQGRIGRRYRLILLL